ncbi:D-lactate dehydrogenase [Salinarchaeum sp. Harcht-Bsk1]|uniref:FAD-binding and (Fe-S)-binding domain-containing protein n=1 Tax=Salinarchaeum sp. Harcht-Bsk1 TaxID=1333523 RepID=UPI0003422E83|nr:FAD-binding and (Fe-S)-binding domain-containing protein [Salinarchaeum sp. Harcht-Bsk1]AGN00213.1 D-lactate dehydrogenase [Salinarchaeum sp. Harcht-Bsk1]
MAQREDPTGVDGADATTADPSTDPRANYDYRGGEEHRPALVAALRERIDGEVRFDEYSRQLYATDASAYEVTPVGVVFPKSTDDVAAVMAYCAEEEIPVLPRGGGTSLAGQTVNEAVVLDFTKHMDDVLAVDPSEAGLAGTARAQPGVTLGELNAACENHDLKFAPDPAWGDKSALGGAIGNNSTGAHSLQYGKTDAYVESVEAVLADGTMTTLGEVDLETIREEADPAPDSGDLLPRIYEAVRRAVDEYADEIDEAYPDMKRNVSGYNLDRLVAEARGGIGPTGEDFGESGTVNLARLLAGSEGTLGIVTEATVSLEPIPETKAVALLAYEDLVTAMEDVEPILEHDPAAVEVLDDVLLNLARDTEEFGALVNTVVPEGAGAMLLVEFYAEDDARGREQTADLLADRVPADVRETEFSPPGNVSTDAALRAFAGFEAHDQAERDRFWKLRKSGLPILLSRTTDAKHISFIEDCAVPPEHLAEYVERFEAILEDHDTFASFYAHAGPGVLHVRPLVNTKTLDGVEQMVGIADAVTDVVTELGGSVSGEHGDGRARSQWNKKLYGVEIWDLSRDLKAAFDPDWLLNPGQICGDETGAIDMSEHLRFDPEYAFESGFESTLEWENANGMQGMVELCHGCGGCRGKQDQTGGVMCPTFRAAEEESLSTRGRANALRQAMSGDLPAEATDEEFVEEILDLCIGCKGCARDCPSEVDMATLKAELTHQHHQEHGTTVRDRLFGDIRRWARLGSATAPVSNWLASLPGAGWLAEQTVGIASERELPTFARTSFTAWMADRDAGVDPADAERRALVFPDTYTEYMEPEIGKATVRVLEAAGVHVDVPEGVTDSGRPAFSKGLLDRARERAEQNVAALEPAIEEGWDVVTVEPSEAAMFQSDYATLLGSERVLTVAENTYGVAEYLDSFDLPVPSVDAGASDRSLVYHGHCHQTAIGRERHAPRVLERAGYEVEVLDSGCCGMAGSFGYEAEHFSMSEAIGGILFEQVDGAKASTEGPSTVVAPGTSCRSQFWDLRGTDAAHPVEVIDSALPDQPER